MCYFFRAYLRTICVSDSHAYTNVILKDANSVGSSSSDNVNEWRSFDKGVSGGGKPRQNKYHANWREENGDRSARGKWRFQGNEERSKGEKWNNSRGDNVQQRKSRQDSIPGSDSGSSNR